MYPDLAIAPDQRAAFVKRRTGAVAGKILADRYGWKIGQKLPIASEIHSKTDGSLDWEFDLVGLFDSDDPAVRANTEVMLRSEERRVGKEWRSRLSPEHQKNIKVT